MGADLPDGGDLEVVVVVAPGVLTHPATARSVLAAAAARRGVGARLLPTASAAGFAQAVRAAGPHAVVVPSDPADLAGTGVLPPGVQVVRLDLTERGPDRSGQVRRHVRGRGLAGLGFALDAVVHHARSPATRVPYGPHDGQHVDVRVPAGPGPFPVAVLVHGGWWRSRWEDDTTEAAAVDLVARGFASVNVEYRPPAAAGWAATTADVASAVGLLGAGGPLAGDPRLDGGRVVLLGHSAGGQLAVRCAADLAARGAAPVLTVSLAGVLDLVLLDGRWSSEGAVSAALGGRAGELPAVYAASSPRARVPVGAAVAVVVGAGEDPDLLEVSRAFAAAAAAAGDDVLLVEGEGDHFAVVDPGSALWAAVVEVLTARVAV